MHPRGAHLPLSQAGEGSSEPVGRLRALEKPVVFKCVWMALLLLLNAHQRSLHPLQEYESPDLVVRIDLITFAAEDFSHVIFLGLILHAFRADAPAFEITQLGLLIKRNTLKADYGLPDAAP